MKTKNILAITTWSYNDALVQTYTLPYIKLIKENIPSSSLVYLVTLEQINKAVDRENKEIIKKMLKSQGIVWIDFRFSKFGIVAIVERFLQLFRLYLLCYIRRINFIHAWCTPAGVTGYLLSKMTSKPLVLDSFEPHAEPSVETGTWKAGSIAFKLLFYFEKKQAKHAKAIIAASTFIAPYAKSRWGVGLKNYYVKPALVDLTRFDYECRKDKELVKHYGLENKIVCVYAGKVGGIYLEQEIFDFAKVCADFWGDRFRFFMITDADRKIVDKLCSHAGLDRNMVISLYLDYKDIARHVGLGDFAINPVKMVKSKICCTSIKDGEYWALGLPVVITDSVGDDVKIISESESGVILRRLDIPSYLEAVVKTDNMLKAHSRRELYEHIRPLAEQYRNFNIAKNIYRSIYSISASVEA